MPCAMCGELSEADGPPIYLYWSGCTVEAVLLSGSRLFKCDTASHNCTSVRPFKDYIAVLWSIPRYRVHLSEWVEQDGGWKPTVLTIRGEWLRWRLFECEGGKVCQWRVCNDERLNHYGISYLTYWTRHPAIPKQPWYFVCEHCQVRARRDFLDRSYDNIDEDGDPWSETETEWTESESDWMATPRSWLCLHQR